MNLKYLSSSRVSVSVVFRAGWSDNPAGGHTVWMYLVSVYHREFFLAEHVCSLYCSFTMACMYTST